MNLNEYQDRAHTTSENTLVGDDPYLYPVMGLAGESGEILNKAKKIYRDHEGEWSDDDRFALADEAGDCLWYIAEICSQLGISLDTVANANLSKLESRALRGKISGSGDNR